MTQAVTDLARLVRDKRRAHGLTQRQLAAATGTTLSRLRDVEQGRISRLDEAFLLQLAGPLHLSADEVRGALRAESKGLQIEVLGPLTVRWDGNLLSIGSPQRRAVLGLLALFAPEPVSRQLITGALWDEHTPHCALHRLQTHVSALRSSLGTAEVIATDGHCYRLMPGTEGVDLAVLRRTAQAARARLADGDREGACAQYGFAVRLVRGPILADLESLRGHPALFAIEQELLNVVLEYADLALEAGLYRELVPPLSLALERSPLNGALTARLMLALTGSGQQVTALHLFEQTRRRFDEVLGLTPDAEVAEAHRRVLRQESARAL